MATDGVTDAADIDLLRSLVDGDAATGTGSTAPRTAALTPGSKATVGSDGLAVAPADAPDQVKQIIAAGNEIAKTPYHYGGGHGKWQDSGYDCSGSVSYALHGAGLLDSALTSGDFTSWGEKGPGQWVTHLRQEQPRVHGRRRAALRHQRPLHRRHALADRLALGQRATRSCTRPGSRTASAGVLEAVGAREAPTASAMRRVG